MSKLSYAIKRQIVALKLFKVKGSWKQIEKQEHYLNKTKTSCKNQISSTGISTSASKLYIYVFEIQKFWRHLKQLELLIGSLSFRQPIHLWQYKPVKGLLRFSLFKYLGRRVCVLTRRQHPPPPLLEKISFYLFNLNF